MARTPKQNAGNNDDSGNGPIDSVSGIAAEIVGSNGDNNAEENGSAGSAGNGGSGIDPDSAIGDDYARNADGSIKYRADGQPARKRGRKSGSGNAGRKTGAGNSGAGATGHKQAVNGAVETLAMAIGGLHLAIAAFAKAPEMQLDDSESVALAKSVVNVLAQFDMSPDPRIVAIGGLIATSAQIYGPRLYLIKERRKEERPIDVTATSVSVAPANGASSGGIDINAFNFTGG